jgi:hypothetical protein
MRQPRAMRQRRLLFDQTPAGPAVRLPPNVHGQLRQALVQWMQALARRINEEDGDEQDHR